MVFLVDIKLVSREGYSFLTGGSVSSLWRMYVWLSSPSSSQGPKPQQGDPAAPGPPCGPAAPHLQLPEGPPDGEGPAASAGGGRGLELPPPLARPEEGDQRGGQHPREGCAALGDSQCFVWAKTHPRGEKNKTTKNMVIPFNLGVRVNHVGGSCESCLRHQCVQVELVNYCTVTHFHYGQLVSIHTVEQNIGQLYFSYLYSG